MILAFFGGLRHTEIMDLEIEKMRNSGDGIYVTHKRAKQRSDKKDSVFLIPVCSNGPNYAAVLEEYLTTIKNELGKYSGRALWTGRPYSFVNLPMGKNIVSAVPKEMARWLNKENISEFTFHSFRRTSATHAADRGATANQLMDFYGWSNSKVAQEYISTSKAAVKTMASNLIPSTKTTDTEGTEPEPEVDVTPGASRVDISKKPFMFNETEATSRLIQNNQQVFVIQNFSGNMHF